jgi:(1->4)-alpha-D-glucan 1-alpha-D-glucosylmutase
VTDRDRSYIEHTLALARSRTSEDDVSTAAYDFLRAVLLLEPPYYLESEKREWLKFVMRWQQFSGPVMAKGLEDTATYRHNSLLSLNEVGGDSLRDRPPLSVEEFHVFNQERLAAWPGTMNATATHDTKRGEDVRARLNVLTEIPDVWEAWLDRWMPVNAAKKQIAGGAQAPDPGEEILIYQTLLGAWPHHEQEVEGFPARVKEFLTKAVREAKVHSSWIRPNTEYEAAVEGFVDALLADEEFRKDLLALLGRIARPGAVNGLAQVLLKIAAPGVPDFYQGTEFWNFALVDPDNRRPLDYRARTAALESLRRAEAEDRVGLIRRLSSDLLRDEVKLWVTCKALEFRRASRELFAQGEYVPVEVRGRWAANVCAFARRREGREAVVVVPRCASHIGDWEDTEVVLPAAERQDQLTCLFPPGLRIADLFREFPVSLLASR